MCMTLKLFIKQRVELEFHCRSDCRTCHLFASYCFTHVKGYTYNGNRHLFNGTLCNSVGWWSSFACKREDAMGKTFLDLSFKKRKSVFHKNLLPYFPNGLTEGMLSAYISLRLMTRSPVLELTAFILHKLMIRLNHRKVICLL